MTTAVVIRPGETDFDQESRIQGALDLPLNARGQTQLAALIDRLRQTPVEVVYASPTEPARTTAKEIGQALDVPVKELEDLTNLNHGLWQGLRIDELRRKFPRVFKQWKESPDTVCPPEGETCAEAVDRVRHALRRPMKKKSAFAVVACEPLATLIAGILRGAEPHLPGPVAGCDDGPLVEVIDTQGDVNGHASPAPDGNGARQDSVQPPASMGDAAP